MKLTKEQQESYDTFLEIGTGFQKENPDSAPMMLCVKDGVRSAVTLAVEGFGDAKEAAIRMVVEKLQPDYFVFQCGGWMTVEEEYKRYKAEGIEHIQDMPPDARQEVFMQFMVERSGKILKADFFKLKRTGGEIELEAMEQGDDALKLWSRFAFPW